MSGSVDRTAAAKPGALTRADGATLRIGTRRSPLALWQAECARAAWQSANPGCTATLVPMETRGDRDPRELGAIGDRGMFAHDLEAALVRGEIDAAVHSAKDLPVRAPHEGGAAPDALVLAAWLPRADPRDALVGFAGGVSELPQGARIATGSARRMSALVTARADLEPSPIRGNVATRISRARERGDAACMLALAGLERLGLLHELVATPLSVDVVVPEAAQGAIVVQTREQDAQGWVLVDDIATRRTVSLERELAARLAGGCDRPVGVHVDLGAGRVWAFSAPAPRASGAIARIDFVGLELAPLLSVASRTDIDEAASWVADQIFPRIEGELAARQEDAQ